MPVRRWLHIIRAAIRGKVERLKEFLSREACCVDVCVKFLDIIGLFSSHQPRSLRRRLSRCNAALVLATSLYSILVSSPVLICNAATAADSRLLDVIEVAGLVFAFSKVTNYVTSFAVHRRRYARMLDTLQEMHAWARRYEQRPWSILKSTQRVTHCACFYVGWGLASTMIITFGQLPRLVAARKFHFKVWFPSSLLASCYGPLLAVWLLFVLTAGVSMVATGALLIDLLGQAIGQLRLLRFNLRTIRRHGCALDAGHRVTNALRAMRLAVGTAGKGGNGQREAFTWEELVAWMARYKGGKECRLQMEQGPTTEPVMLARIRQCVIHHQLVIRYLDEMGSAFSLILTHQLLGTLVPTAMGLILITHSKVLDMKVVSYVVLTFGGMTSFFVFCWLASEVTKESELVKDAVFHCDWLSASDGFKRSMRIIISMSNRPIVFKSIFAPISMCTFREVIRVVYSYYMFVISTMKRERLNSQHQQL